ncbi:hypothetical protein [Vibrio hepatarius]|uniref:hypothetical protein n=1 Tax=Vibrio hepatarius TaxID=171383 RepID=UPI00142D6E02|nr:hypothetical protein [Vibrio hepatarius]NIY83309.1 hypothetical protein [Vibrio hepatarius]
MDIKLIRKVILDCLKVGHPSYPKSDVLTFACDNDRYIDFNGKKYSPLIDTLEDDLNKLGLTTVSITRIASTIKGDISYGNALSPEGPFARAMILKRLKGMTTSDYPFSHYEYSIWQYILDKVMPKVVVGINPSRELCKLCHERGIWVADIQHGVISDSHPWYGEKFRSSDPNCWLPSAFLVWDEGSFEVMDKWCQGRGIDVIQTGNPWISRFLKKEASDKLVTFLTNKHPIVVDKKKRTIVLSLSWGDVTIPNGFIHPELERFMKQHKDEFNWIVRLHPNQLKGFASDEGVRFSKYWGERFSEFDIDWEYYSSIPLPLILSNVDYHITWSSSVCIEAAKFNVKSLVMNPEFRSTKSDYYTELENQGFVYKIECKYELISNWLITTPPRGRDSFNSVLRYRELLNFIKERATN